MSEKKCAVCKKEANQCCSGCNTVYYCNREHQKIHWKNGHKYSCAPYKIQTNSILGRHLVATRNIKEGEVILKKNPLVLAPKTASYPICLGCHKRLTDISCKCSKCGWPICDITCENSKYHAEECKILTGAEYNPKIKTDGSKDLNYSCFAVLRTLLLKSREKNKFESIMDMQHHLERCMSGPLYKILGNNLAALFVNTLKLKITQEEILKMCSIFDTNSFDVRDSERQVNVRGLYPVVSLMAHDCKNNTKHSFHGEDFQIIVLASVPISKGETITTTYTQTLWGTLTRRIHLKQAKHFDCGCRRCSDPTEFGTFAGSIYCSICRRNDKGDDCPKMVSEDPLDNNATWKCQSCDHKIGGKQIVWGNEAIRKEISLIDKGKPEEFEEFLTKYRDAFHPSNYHCLEVKYALSQMYGNIEGYFLTDLTDELLERKINLCHELLLISDVLQPGITRFRGHLMYDLQAAIVVKSKRDYEGDLITKEEAKENLQEAMKILQKSAKILSTEPGMKEILEERILNLVEILDFD